MESGQVRETVNPVEPIRQSGFFTTEMVLGIMLVLMVLAAGFGAVRVVTAAPETVSLSSPIPPPAENRDRPATIESTRATATARATKWNPAARLMAVTAQYDYPNTPTSLTATSAGGWIVYVFAGGTGEDTETLTILIERSNAVTVRESVRHLGVDSITIDDAAFDTVIISSSSAFEIANTVAGSSFRNACPVRRYVVRVAFRPADATSPAYWVVSYNDSDASTNPILRVFVDATTGETGVKALQQISPDRATLDTCSAN